MDPSKGGMTKFIFSVEELIRQRWTLLLAYFRSGYWRHVLGRAPRGFRVYGKIFITHPHRVSVGHNVKFSEGVYINARAPVTIGNHVRLSAFVRINTGALNLDVPPNQRFEHTKAPVTIGDHVWLATGVMVNPGVTIHDGVVVGAGAVVTRDLPPYTLCVGVPAKPIRDLPQLALNETLDASPSKIG